MKGIPAIFLAFFLWLRPLRWVAGLGLVLLLLAPPAAQLDRNLGYGLAIYGFIALGFPCVLAPIAFRIFVSNRRLSLLPHFHLRAGLALLLLALLYAACLPVAFLAVGAPPNPLLFAGIFAAASLYVGIMQLVLPSRHLLAICSFMPVLLFLLINRFGDVLLALVLDRAFLIVLVALCAIGWGWGLLVLRRAPAFWPVHQAHDREDWLYMDFGWSNRHGLGRIRTAAGTLLLGYPDAIGSRLLRTLNFALLSPLVCLLALYVVGPSEENLMLDNLPAAFLGFCLFASLLATVNYGEMAARCRLLWLRQGSGRPEQWRLLENNILLNLALLYGVVGSLAGLLWAFTDLPGEFALHTLALLISRTLFDVYFNLAGRVKAWPRAITTVLGVLSGIGMAVIVGVALYRNDHVLLVALEAAQILLAVLFRLAARGGFRHIDWHRVALRTAPRGVHAPAHG